MEPEVDDISQTLIAVKASFDEVCNRYFEAATRYRESREAMEIARAKMEKIEQEMKLKGNAYEAMDKAYGEPEPS
jgi:hypothetical protein